MAAVGVEGLPGTREQGENAASRTRSDPRVSTALLLKIAVPPVLVALMSLAARRWGATVGGLIMGLPWMTGPVLFFLALDKGTDFGVRATLGIQLAVWGMGAFLLSYGYLARFARWPLCLAVAVVGFFATAMWTQNLDVPLWLAAAGAVLTLIGTYLLLPKPTSSAVPGVLPWWDIPARMLATLLLVAMIMLSADRLGPQLSGIVASYPVIMTVIGAFTHHQWGPDAVLRIHRGISLSLLAFVAFFLIVGYGMPVIGLVASFALAAVAAIATSGALIAVSRRR